VSKEDQSIKGKLAAAVRCEWDEKVSKTTGHGWNRESKINCNVEE
jgi:hypothetical protein